MRHARVAISLAASALLLSAGAQADVNVVHADYGTLTIAGYAIARYTYQYGENAAGFSTATSTFALRSASIIFCGDIFKYAGYNVYVDAVATPALMDAYGTFKAIPRTEIKAGQFLVPFSREAYTSTSKLLFIDRSLAANGCTSALGRDVGVQAEFALKPEGKPYWGALAAAGLNGTGPNAADDNTAKDLALRLAGNPLPWEAMKGLTAEAYYYLGKPSIYDPTAPTYEWGIGDETKVGGCLAFDHARFTVQTEYLALATKLAANAEHTAYELKRGGLYAGASYKQPLPWPWLQQLEPCARWETYDPDRDAPDDRTGAVTGGVNLHFDGGHHCKLMLNYQSLREEGPAVDNDKISGQFQVRF